MRGIPRRQNGGWWISPAIPTIANAALAALWGFTTLGGWGRTAFCDNDTALDLGCSDRFDRAVTVSAVPATLAALICTAAWLLPSIRREPRLLDALLTVSALAWVLAEAVLFVGGWIAQS